ncbi:uncharacterized protein AB9X84_004341 isoform 1-T1 [Acanthopagrus schlegelii]
METRDPRPNPQVSEDDGGLEMKTDSDPVADHTDSPPEPCGEKPEDEPQFTPPAPALIRRYYGVMDDEGADAVFIAPLPPSYVAPLLPAGGSTDAMVTNPSLTLANGASDATAAKGNPSGLDWHGEEQLMAAYNKVDEVKASTAQTSDECMDTLSLSKDRDSTLPKDQDQTAMEDAGSLVESWGLRPGEQESSAEPEVSLSGGQENLKGSEAEKDQYPKQVPSSIDENSFNETHFDNEEDKTASGHTFGLAEVDSKLTKENNTCDSVKTNDPAETNLNARCEVFASCGPPEVSKCNPTKMEAATSQPQVPAMPTETEEYVDTRSLDYNLTKYNWGRRESGETQVPQLPIFEGTEETVTKGDRSRSISIEIQQGEQLLQRLQQVQLRQDVSTPESPGNTQQVVQEGDVFGADEDDLKGTEGDLTAGDKKGESRSHTVDDEGGKLNLTGEWERENNENKDEKKARLSSSPMPVEPEHEMTVRTQAGDSDDPRETYSAEMSLPSTCHQFSTAETSAEKQIHEASQETQNLQRAGGLFNLADDPDVLEIPFKTNISLEPLATTASPGQRSDWQFSEKKMQKEISQEIQRELVLVNQGKIPGGYSKGEVRQLKETKLLFEAFQQENPEGPTRFRRSPTLLKKGHVYPSVLERTRSLEMFSLKSYPVSRTHSLRLYKSTSDAVKIHEDLRSKSPTGGSRDKTRLFPYPKQDKHVRLHRSMDSISTATSAMEARQVNATQGSPIIKQNPFYKLRPALARQPEVEKDIREAKEREEELRRQRCTLYGENRQSSEDGEKSRFTSAHEPDDRRLSRGKLERVWPPPSKSDQAKSDQAQQESKVHRAGRQKAPLWQRWEAGLVNGQPSKEKN